MRAITTKVCIEKLFCTHQNLGRERTARSREEKGEVPDIGLKTVSLPGAESIAVQADKQTFLDIIYIFYF